MEGFFGDKLKVIQEKVLSVKKYMPNMHVNNTFMPSSIYDL